MQYILNRSCTYLVNAYFIIYPSIICLCIISIYLSSTYHLTIIIVSSCHHSVIIENMNTIQPTHLPVGPLAVVKVNCLGSLVGCLGVVAPVLSGKIDFTVGLPHELRVFR